MFSSPPGALWILILEESHLSDGLWRVCVRGPEGGSLPHLWLSPVRGRGSGGGGWKSPSEAASSSPPPPPGFKHFPSLPCSCVPPSSVGSTPLARNQNFYTLFGMSDPSQFPLQEERALQALCAHLNTCLSLCPRAPGADCVVAWGGSPASVSGPCQDSPSRQGTPTTSANGSGMSGWHVGKGR